MIHPVPPGTRDVLPDEMRELRALTARLLVVFEEAGYGEVWTPTLEYEEVLRRGDDRAAGAGYRLFDEHGQVLVLRSDMTIPIARVVSSRYSDRDVPIRLCYFAHAYRDVDMRSGQAREFLQGGLELIGIPEPQGDAEIAGLVIEALDTSAQRAQPPVDPLVAAVDLAYVSDLGHALGAQGGDQHRHSGADVGRLQALAS